MSNKYHRFAMIFTVLSLIGFFCTILLIANVTEKNRGGKVTSFTSLNVSKIKKIARKRAVSKKKKMAKRRKKAKALRPVMASTLSGNSFGMDMDDSLSGVLDNDLLSSNENVVMDENSVDSRPRIIQRGEVIFPDKAVQENIASGFVELRMLINKFGAVSKTEIIEANPIGVFEESSLAMVQSWKFEPAKYRGNSVAIWVKQVVRFGE